MKCEIGKCRKHEKGPLYFMISLFVCCLFVCCLLVVDYVLVTCWLLVGYLLVICWLFGCKLFQTFKLPFTAMVAALLYRCTSDLHVRIRGSAKLSFYLWTFFPSVIVLVD